MQKEKQIKCITKRKITSLTALICSYAAQIKTYVVLISSNHKVQDRIYFFRLRVIFFLKALETESSVCVCVIFFESK